jgi:glycerol-3-phosphate cytidylyltransferase
MVVVITFGTFDLFHYGHLKILERAKSHGDRLIVGLSTDELNMSKKNRKPVFEFKHRKALLEALKCVDDVFPEESLELKQDYIDRYKADILIMGDDWKGRFDYLQNVSVMYLERTPVISTSDYINNILTNYK